MNSEPVVKPITSDLPRVGAAELLDGPVKDAEKPVPLRALLTRPVVVSVVNYGMIGLLEVTAVALIPLIWSTSVEFGGLGMSPTSIGLWMAGYGFLNGIFQFVAFPHIVGRLGPRRVFIASILCFFPVYIMFPFENLALRDSGSGMSVIAGLLIMLQLSAISLTDMGFSTLPSTSLCIRSLKLCGSIRRDIYVYLLCFPQQAVSRRHERNRADNGLDSAYGRTSCCCVAVRILTGQQYLGRKLCVCRAARPRVGCARRRFAAPQNHMET